MRTNWPSVTTYDPNENFKHLRFAWRLLCYITPIPISVQLLSIIREISGGVQSLSHVHLFMTLWTAAGQASLSFSISWSLLKLMSIESVTPSNHLIPRCLFLFLPSVFPASGSFPMSRFFASGGQSIGTSALASVLPMNIQGCFMWVESKNDCLFKILDTPKHTA